MALRGLDGGHAWELSVVIRGQEKLLAKEVIELPIQVRDAEGSTILEIPVRAILLPE